jgi:TolB-like protein
LPSSWDKGRVERPGEILGQLRSKIKQMFVQEGTIREQKDGIDMAIAVIDKKKKGAAICRGL